MFIRVRFTDDVSTARSATCLFCNKPASSYDIDKIFTQECALELNNTALRAKLAPGDMIFLERRYSAVLQNKARIATSGSGSHNDLHELVVYIETNIVLVKLVKLELCKTLLEYSM